jgi:hypothetical protein
VLVAGHARGVSFTNDGGAHWQSLNTNFPTVPVHAVVFQPRDNSLVVGTYARGVWIRDDVGALEAMTTDAAKKDAVGLDHAAVSTMQVSPRRTARGHVPGRIRSGDHVSPS